MITRTLYMIVAILFAANIYAQDYKALLIGYNQSLPVVSEGIGYISAEYDGEFLRIEGIVQNLEGTFELGFNGGVGLYRGTQGTIGEKIASMLPFVDDDGKGFELIEVANRFELSPEEVIALNNNELYINVGTDLHPEGEIRAQLVADEAEVFYCTLLGSQVTHPFPTLGHGTVLMTYENEILSISGAFRNLEGDFDTDALGNANLRSAHLGSDGPSLANLTVEADTVSNAGIIRNAENQYAISAETFINLTAGGVYVEVASSEFNRAEIRGQASRPAKQLYLANLRSYNALPFNNSRATCKILLARNHGDSLYISGSFQGLESSLATEFAGGTILYDGRQGQEGSVKELLVPTLGLGNRFGTFDFENNFFTYLPSDLAKLDKHELYVTIHSEERFSGEIRGQILPIGQNNFSVVMNELQIDDPTDFGYKSYIDAVQFDDQIIFSGTLLDSIANVEANSLSVKEGLPGKSDVELMALTMSEDDNGNFTIIDPDENQFDLATEDILRQLFNREAHLSLNDNENEILRGQLLPMLQSLYFVPLSDRQELHQVNSTAKGMLILEQHNDSEIIVSGTFENLNSSLRNSLTGDILLSQGKFGELGSSFRAIVPVPDVDGQGGEILPNDNRFFIQNSIADSLQVSGLYINVLTEEEADGEIRGQVLELADGYYNTRLDAVNVVNSSLANGLGQVLFIRKGQQLIVNGSFSELDGPINISNNGGASIRSEEVDQNGELKFLLFPEYASDSLSGTFLKENNTLFLGNDDLEDLKNEEFYVEVRKTSQDGPALRGQIQLFKNVSPTSIEISAPLDRDTILIDGLVTDRLIFDFNPVEGNTSSLKISDRPDFMPPLYVQNFGFSDDISLSYEELDNLLLNSSVIQGDTLRLYYRIINSDGADYNNGELRSIFLVRGLVTGVPDIFRAELTANHSMPPRQSTGYGQITAELLDTTLRISGEINDLMGEFEAMHIHMGMAGTNGPVVFELNPQITQGGNGVMLLNVDNTFELTPTMVDTLEDRGLYINVHTSLFTSGEVRGQILPEADAYYYANLMGSNLVDNYVTEAAGALSIEVRDGSMTVTGTYNDLESPYDFNVQGGSHFRFGLPGEDGPILFSLVPVELDSLNGVYQAQSNTFNISDVDLSILERRSLYADIRTEERQEGALRGVITPILKGVFRSNLGSLHHRHIMNDYAQGTLQIDLDIEDNIGVYGTFNNLSFATNDFENLIQYRYGFDDEVRDIFSLAVDFEDQDSISGTLLFESNEFAADEDIVNELLHRAHHINIDLQDNLGGIRGQVQGLASQYYTAKLNGYQMLPSQGGGQIKSVFAERVGESILFSGAVSNAASSLSINQEVIGKEGVQIIAFNGNDVNGDFLINPYVSTVPVSGSLDGFIDDHAIYIQHDNPDNNSSQRGQILSDVRFIHLGLPSGIGQLFSIDTEAEGRALFASYWDDTYRVSGAVQNLSGGLADAISGGIHLHFKLPGSTSEINNELASSFDSGIYTIQTTSLDSSILFESLLRENKLYIDVHSIDYPNGELRSQLRPLANHYYTATLNGVHVIADSNSPALGKMNLDVTDTKAVYYGSYNNLSFPLGSDEETSSVGYNFVYEDFNPVQSLNLVKTNASSGEWNAIDNTYEISQDDQSALDNKLSHIAATDIFENIVLRGRLLEEINQFPNATSVITTVPNDTLLIEGDLTAVYQSTWPMATDDEELMYKFQMSTDPAFADVIYERNTLNQNTVSISFVQLQSSLSIAGIETGDTVDLYQRVFITDGSEDVFSTVSNYTAIRGVVEEPIEMYRVYLSGYQQKNPVTSRGQGTLNLVLQGNVLTVDGSFVGLESSLADQLSGGAHIQIGLAGEEGPIMYSLDVDSGADATSGVINEFDNIFELTEAQVTLLKNRELYVSIYSDRYTTGELRGQILPISSDYLIAAINASQYHDPEYVLNAGQLVIEVHSDSLRITGSIDHEVGATYALYSGLAGQEGQKIVDLVPTISADNSTAQFMINDNNILNEPGLLGFMQKSAVYVATDNGNSLNLRGQIVPEIRAAFYSNLSGLKTVKISNSFGEGRVLLELGKDDEITISGSIAGLEGTPSDVILASGFPGQAGSVINTLSPIVGTDPTALVLDGQNNSFTIATEIIDLLFDRMLYIQLNSDNEVDGELRGQLMGMAPMYAESIITGSQISANQSSQAYGLVEMEIHPQEISALGSISGLMMEIDDVEYINAAAALEGDIISSMIWQHAGNGIVTMSYGDNQQLYNEQLVTDIETNRVSVRVFSAEFPLGEARGIIMPPAQGLFIAPLSGAALTERTDNSGAGIAMLVLRNDSEVKFVAGVEGIPTNALRFRFGKGLPGIVDDNPFNYLGFQANPFGGQVYNNNLNNNFTEQIIADIRQGLHHIKISSNANNSFVDHVRGQILPLGYQSYQSTFTNYHPQEITESDDFGKLKATLNGDVLSLVGHTSISDSEITGAWIGVGGVNEVSVPLYSLEVTGQDILLQESEILTAEDLMHLRDKKMHVSIATDEYINGAIRAQLMPEINYYPAANPFNMPANNATLTLAGDSSELFTIDWSIIESPDDLKYVWELSTDDSFDDILLRLDRKDNDFVSFTYAALDSLLKTDLQLAQGDMVELFHRVVTTDGSEDVFGDAFALTIVLDELVDVNEYAIVGLERAQLLPNITLDASTSLQLTLSDNKNLKMDVVNNYGAILYSKRIESKQGESRLEIEIGNLSSGQYHVILRDENGGIKSMPWMIIK